MISVGAIFVIFLATVVSIVAFSLIAFGIKNDEGFVSLAGGACLALFSYAFYGGEEYSDFIFAGLLLGLLILIARPYFISRKNKK